MSGIPPVTTSPSRQSRPSRARIGLVVGIVTAGFLGLVVATWLHGGSTTPVGSTLKVVAAENFWGDIARQIGGSAVSVTSIMNDPNADPHLYESGARDAAAVAAASVVVQNGAGYDEFMTKLLAGAPAQGRTVLTAAEIAGVAADANPHVWYLTAKVPDVAAEMASAFTAHDPAHADLYVRNLQQFTVSMKPLNDTIALIKQQYPGAAIAYTEPVPAYLTAAAGLENLTPPDFASAIEAGNDPGPAATAAMNGLITSRRIKVLLYNAQAVSPVTERLKNLAQANDVPVLAVTETLPAGEANFQSWQLHQAQAILEALSKS